MDLSGKSFCYFPSKHCPKRSHWGREFQSIIRKAGLQLHRDFPFFRKMSSPWLGKDLMSVKYHKLKKEERSRVSGLVYDEYIGRMFIWWTKVSWPRALRRAARPAPAPRSPPAGVGPRSAPAAALCPRGWLAAGSDTAAASAPAGQGRFGGLQGRPAASPRRLDAPLPTAQSRTHGDEGAVEVEALPAAPGRCHPSAASDVPQGGQGEEQQVEADVAPQEGELAAVVVPGPRSRAARPPAVPCRCWGLQPAGSAAEAPHGIRHAALHLPGTDPPCIPARKSLHPPPVAPATHPCPRP